jgi:hypothetical protein
MAGMRLEYCAIWQQMASAQESNNQMAIGGLRQPNEKNCGAAMDGSCRPKEKLRLGNQRMALAKRKICGAAIDKLRWPKEKNAVWQSWYCASQEKNCGAAINGLCRPKEKITARRLMDCAGQKEKIQCSNWGIMPASLKFAGGLEYHAEWLA